MMIRITQTYMIIKIIEKLEQMKWKTVYKDLPHGRRSGIGIHGKINLLFERIYDMSPDILLIKENTLLLIEVDNTIPKTLFSKFEKYNSKKGELLKRISCILEQDINKLNYGFGITKNMLMKGKIPYLDFYWFSLRTPEEVNIEII